MNYHHATTSNPHTLSLWPDASAASEELVGAQAAEYPQPGLTAENIYFEDLDNALAWGQSGTTPAEAYGFQTDFAKWTFGGTVAADIISHGTLPNATAIGTTTTIAPTTTPPLTNNVDAYAHRFFFTQTDFSASSGTPSLTDLSPLPSPQCDGTGNEFLPFPTVEATSSYFAQPSGTSFPQFDIAGASDPNLVTWAPPTLFAGSNFAGQVQPGYGPILNPTDTFSAPLDYTQLTDHPTTPTEALNTMVTHEIVSSSSLGKRSRQSDENGSGGPRRGRPSATRVPGGAGSAKRTRRSPVTRTRTIINGKSKAAGRGAERLASTLAQGVYPRSLSGLSVLEGSVGVLEQEQPSWIVGREQVETWREMASSAPLQSSGSAEDGEGLHKIPRNLTERERLMLQTTQTEEERGAVSVIKCRLCPKPQFSTFVTFQRHCKSCEKHPSEVRFCPRCGDFFGRRDSNIRHNKKKYQEACLSTSPDDARQKRQKVERLLEAFEARLEHCLRSGEDIGPRFSDVMAGKLTNSSKKVFKPEGTCVQGDSWATGLC